MYSRAFSIAWFLLFVFFSFSCGSSGGDTPSTLEVTSSMKTDDEGWTYVDEPEPIEIANLTVAAWAFRPVVPSAEDVDASDEAASEEPLAQKDLPPTKLEIRTLGPDQRPNAEGLLSIATSEIPEEEKLKEMEGKPAPFLKDISSVKFHPTDTSKSPISAEDSELLLEAFGNRLIEEDLHELPLLEPEEKSAPPEEDVPAEETVPAEEEGIDGEVASLPSAAGNARTANFTPHIAPPTVAAPESPDDGGACAGRQDSENYQCGGQESGAKKGFAAYGRPRFLPGTGAAVAGALVLVKITCAAAAGTGGVLTPGCVGALFTLSTAIAAHQCESGKNVLGIAPGIKCSCNSEFPNLKQETRYWLVAHKTPGVSRCIGCPSGTSWDRNLDACVCANGRRPTDNCCTNQTDFDGNQTYQRDAVCHNDNNVCQRVTSVIKNTNGQALYGTQAGSPTICYEFVDEVAQESTCVEQPKEQIVQITSGIPNLPRMEYPASIKTFACKWKAPRSLCNGLVSPFGADNYDDFVAQHIDDPETMSSESLPALYKYKDENGKIQAFESTKGYSGGPTSNRVPGEQIRVLDGDYGQDMWWIEAEGGEINWCECFNSDNC